MESVVDLAESRKARSEKTEQLQEISQSLLMLLEQHRPALSEDFMTFLLAVAVSDQALFYSRQAKSSRQAGRDFIDHLFNTASMLFDSQFSEEGHATTGLASDAPCVSSDDSTASSLGLERLGLGAKVLPFSGNSGTSADGANRIALPGAPPSER